MIEKTAIVKKARVNPTAYVGNFCLIGLPPEKLGVYPESLHSVEIGEGTVLTGHCTVDAGVRRPTVIGRDCFIMKHVHIGHCCQIGSNVIIAPGAVIGGGVTVGDGCNFGINSVVHPNQSVPPFCMIGMGAIITKGLQMVPFGIYAGNPAKFIKINEIGIEKAGLSKEDVERITDEWNNKY